MTVKVKAEWTEATGELIDLLKSRNVDRDTCIGIGLTLEKDANYKALIQWINKHPKAGQTEIMRQVRVIRKDIFSKCKPVSYDLPPSPMSRAAKKVASVAVF